MKELYQSIIEAIEYLLYYYSNLFGFAVEEAEVKAEHRDQGKHGMTYFVATVPKMKESEYTTQEMRRIMQEYMETCILPASQIKPYSVGQEIIEALYIDSVAEKQGDYKIDIVYVDNDTSFRLVKNAKRFERRERHDQ